MRYAKRRSMKQKTIIRIRRKNEFNGYWAFLVASSIIFGTLLITAATTKEIFIILIVLVVIIIWATLYQGFEVIIE